MIQTREEVMKEISGSERLSEMFFQWKKEQQEAFLDFCTGNRGVKILYDSFFKEILNPEIAPERIEEFLSLILKQEVRILTVLPNDTVRIADEQSLVIMDIVVELEDHSIANVEVQKIGYLFAGQLFYMKKVLRNFGSIRKSTSIIFHRNPILESRWNYCRNTCIFRLTYSGNLCKIEV